MDERAGVVTRSHDEVDFLLQNIRLSTPRVPLVAPLVVAAVALDMGVVAVRGLVVERLGRARDLDVGSCPHLVKRTAHASSLKRLPDLLVAAATGSGVDVVGARGEVGYGRIGILGCVYGSVCEIQRGYEKST